VSVRGDLAPSAWVPAFVVSPLEKTVGAITAIAAYPRCSDNVARTGHEIRKLAFNL
jgi:hypothetical protein